MLVRVLDGSALGLVLLLPWLLLHARAAAEAAIDLVGLAFVVRCAVLGEFGWVRRAWVVIAAAFWGWLVVCTAVAEGPVWQAVAMGRLLVFLAALEGWVFAEARARVWFGRSLGAATAYLVGQVLLQFGTGHNLFGVPRSPDGELTGPFTKPRAGPTLVRMLFPALLPGVGTLLARPGWGARLAGVGLCVGGVMAVVLIGQRMPVLLAALGLVVAAGLLPRLRGPALVALVAGGALIGASAVVSPPTFYRLVTKFSRQVGDFADSPYGLIAERSVAMGEQHPWFGRGYDGFKTGCADPRYFQGWHWPGTVASGDGGGAEMCVTHPHNHFLQALVEGGVPGLVLFCALLWVWLGRLGRGLWREPEPLRVGLFAAAVLQEWPVSSTSPLVSLPIGGWFFLLLGFGLALVPARGAVAPAVRDGAETTTGALGRA